MMAVPEDFHPGLVSGVELRTNLIVVYRIQSIKFCQLSHKLPTGEFLAMIHFRAIATIRKRGICLTCLILKNKLEDAPLH